MNSRPTIGTGFLADFSRLVEELGGDATALLASEGLAPSHLDNPDARIDYRAYADLLERAADMTDCPHFGLLLGQRHDLSLLGSLGLLAKHCDSVGGALEAVCRYYSVMSQSSIYHMQTTEEQVLLIREPTLPQLAHRVQLQDISLAEGAQILHAVAGLRLSTVYFTHPRPARPDVYRKIFRCEVLFDQELQALALPRRELSRPLALADTETRRYLERQLARQVLGHREDLVREVRKTIRLLMTTGQCNVESAADHLGMHSRTLHRHLRRQDTTFTELLEETRRALASELMRDSHLDIQRISQILGYSDATAFSRAFKRWHGMPPAGWRAAH